jgi:hypothetical protein
MAGRASLGFFLPRRGVGSGFGTHGWQRNERCQHQHFQFYQARRSYFA